MKQYLIDYANDAIEEISGNKNIPENIVDKYVKFINVAVGSCKRGMFSEIEAVKQISFLLDTVKYVLVMGF